MANLRHPQPKTRYTVSACNRPNCLRIEIDNPTLALLLVLGVGAIVYAATSA